MELRRLLVDVCKVRGIEHVPPRGAPTCVRYVCSARVLRRLLVDVCKVRVHTCRHGTRPKVRQLGTHVCKVHTTSQGTRDISPHSLTRPLSEATLLNRSSNTSVCPAPLTIQAILLSVLNRRSDTSVSLSPPTPSLPFSSLLSENFPLKTD